MLILAKNAYLHERIMDTYTQTHFEVPLGPIFEVRTASEWLAEAAALPQPKRLIGGLWREGELAIMFGGQGLGKSVLATQIADAVSLGRGFGPFETEAAAQQVIYLDLKLTAKQFAMRYAGEENDPSYGFAEGLQRIHVNLDAELPAGCRSFSDYLVRAITQLVEQTGAKALVVDNITHLMRSNDVVRDVLPLMRELNRLKRSRGLSILVVAQSKKLARSRYISIDDLQSARILGNFADSIFAIGDGGRGGAERYIKHLKSRSGEVLYDHSLTPKFRIAKIDGNYLGFVYDCCVTEGSMYGDHRDHRDWEKIDEIKQMSDDGTTIRDIADKLDMSKTSVHRLLQMWLPPAPNAAIDAYVDTVQDANDLDFPGREQFTAALAAPKFKKMFDSYDEEDRSLQREYGIIERACARARRDLKKNGTFTPLADDPEYVEFLTFGLAGPPDENRIESFERGETTPWETTDGQPPETSHPLEPMDRLKRSADANGRDIFIEKENAAGKPTVWYVRRKDGKFTHKIGDSTGSIGITVDGPICRLNFSTTGFDVAPWP